MLLDSTFEFTQARRPRMLQAAASRGAVPKPTTAVHEWAAVLSTLAACTIAVMATVLGGNRAQLMLGSTSATAASDAERSVAGAYRIESIATAQNRVVVDIASEAGTPLRGDLAISVNGGPPRLIDGSMLPGSGSARIELDEVVQRRAPVTLEVRTADGRSARTVSTILAPDASNDLELYSARVDGDGMLIAAIRNNSPIPLRGTVMVAARDPGFPYTLLARTNAALQVEAKGSQEIPIGLVGPIDLERTWIGLTTDAIQDADIGNDVLAHAS